MAGPLYRLSGSVDGVNTSEWTADSFYWLRKGFDAHAGFTRIASYYGVGGAGLGRYNGTDGGTSGDCRWAVYRKTAGLDTFDVIIAASVTNTTDVDPSGSYYIGGNTAGIGFAIAWDQSGQAWNGTTNNNGQDSFITPWKSGAIVLPRTNGLWGEHSGSKNCLASLKNGYSYLEDGGTLTFIGDDDNFLIIGDGGEVTPAPNNAIYTMFGGVFYINPSSGAFDLPYALLSNPTAQSDPVIKRSVLNTSTVYNSGLWISKPTGTRAYNSNSFGYGLDWDVVGTLNNYPLLQSNPSVRSGSVFHEHPILVFAANPFMYVGYLDFLRAVTARHQSGDRIASGSRAVIGFGSNASSETLFTSCSIPWSSSYGVVATGKGTFYVSSSVFLTSSLHGYSHVTQSFLYDRTVVTASTEILYRALFSGSYVYATNTIPAGDNVVIIGTFKRNPT